MPVAATQSTYVYLHLARKLRLFLLDVDGATIMLAFITYGQDYCSVLCLGIQLRITQRLHGVQMQLPLVVLFYGIFYTNTPEFTLTSNWVLVRIQDVGFDL